MNDVTNNANESKLKVGQCECPLCGSECIDYGTIEVTDGGISYPATCCDCGAEWNEDYELSFSGVSGVHTKEGKLVANVLDLNGEEQCPIE